MKHTSEFHIDKHILVDEKDARSEDDQANPVPPAEVPAIKSASKKCIEMVHIGVSFLTD